MKRLNFVAHNHVAVVDEFKLTINCSSCFEVTTKTSGKSWTAEFKKE